MRELKPELKTFTNETLPVAYEHQIRSFIRIHWWDVYAHDLDAPIAEPNFQPMHFVVGEGDALYSSASAQRKPVEHQGQTYICYGLGDVMTYPSFRKRGFGSWAVGEATQYIQKQPDADIAILWTDPPNFAFYEKLGWERTPKIHVTVGDLTTPEESEGEVFMLFISDRAKTNRPQFEQHTFHFGDYAW